MLHTETRGEGPELVLLHGWGMHSGVWGAWQDLLCERFRVTAVDLPGHGLSAYSGERGLGDWADQVLAVAPRRARWVGWSLGGLVAMAAAQQDAPRLRGVVLLASTPRFVVAHDWPMAMAASLLVDVAQQLATQPERTLKRFVALQLQGSDGAGEALRELRARLRSRPDADAAALQAGLVLLREADLRPVLRTSSVPLHWLLGAHDRLIPAGVRHAFPALQAQVIDTAGHAPFLSHPRACARQVQRWFLDDCERTPDAAERLATR